MLPHHPNSPSFADVVAAADRIAGLVVRTPLLQSDLLNQRVGGQILIKPECLQVRGSFKARGASNALALIPEAIKPRGVVAFSSGNHAQGVALAAKRQGVPATIIVPSDAPMGKIAAAERDGARIILYDRLTESREAIGAKLADETGATLIKPFDDPAVIAGQGTIGLEMVEQARALGHGPMDAMLACASGGGLMAGITLAFQELSPQTCLYSVEPDQHDDLARSLKSGQLERNAPGVRSICDALMVETPGEITTPILMNAGVRGLTVSDDDVLAAMGFAFEHLKLVVEPGGAVALAAILAGKLHTEKQTIGIVLSGGNVDAALFQRAIRTE
jgi:threonine dehydratase